MIRPIFAAVAACLMLAACEPSGVMGEIDKAEAKMAKDKADVEAKRKASSGPNLEAGNAFMARKEAEGGWTKTASGVLYRYVRKNPAPLAKPSTESQVLVFYEGKLIDGTVFDSAYQNGQPAGFQVTQVVPGFSEMLQVLKPGETIDAILPAALAYGENGQGDTIGPNQTLQFRIELLAFRNPTGEIVGNPAQGARDAPAAAAPPPPPSAPKK